MDAGLIGTLTVRLLRPLVALERRISFGLAMLARKWNA